MTEIRMRVKWPGGFVDVSDGGTGTVITRRHDAGDAATVEEAIASGQAALAAYGGSPRRSVEATVGDTPAWVQTGDAVSVPNETGSGMETVRVMDRKVLIQQGGLVTLQPSLITREEDLTRRQQRDLKRLTNGSQGGRNSAAVPLLQVPSNIQSGKLSGPGLDTWSTPLNEMKGPEIRIKRPTVATLAEAILTDPVTDDVRFDIYLNDVLASYIEVPAGEVQWTITGSLLLIPNDRLRVDMAEVNSLTYVDTEGITATIQWTTAPGSFDRSD